MNRNYVLWLVLLGSLIFALGLMLALTSPGWAAAPQPPEPLTVPISAVPPVFLEPSPFALEKVSSYFATVADLFPNCRYGIAAWSNLLLYFDIVPNLGTGWYLDFTTHWTPSGPTSEAEFVQMVRLHQGRALRNGTDICGPDYAFTVSPSLTEGGLGAIVAANPGALWIVGNEPDRVVSQDDICPQQYAVAYHNVYHFIKSHDPTAQIANAGLVEVTPGRLQYLDIVWDTYLEKYGVPMPVDVWTMHIYILPEGPGESGAAIALGTDPALAIQLCDFSHPIPPCFRYADHDNLDLFKAQVVRMREWMKRHGQQHKPLALSEYSILYPFEDYDDPVNPTRCYLQDENGKCFTPVRVASFMTRTFGYLEPATDANLGYPADGYRLVQQWLWFSLATGRVGKASNLIDPGTYALTLQGRTWQNYVGAIPPAVNLSLTWVPTVVGRSPNGTDPVTAALSAEVVNNGNIVMTSMVTVTFYNDQELTAPIGSAVFSGLGGCARRSAIVTTTWENLETGAHPFWVKVDSTEMVTETLETDNVGQGVVIVNPFDVFLPLTLRNG